MKKDELLPRIQELTSGDYSKKTIDDIVSALTTVISDELHFKGEIRIYNLGTFRKTEVAERMGRNPKTGDPVKIPAHNRLRFAPSLTLKRSIKG